MRRIAMSLAVLGCVGFATCAGLNANAESNLLFNPGFDDVSRLDGWINTSPSGLNVQFESAMDRLGSPDSGAIRITNDSASPSFVGRVTQCVGISTGADIEFGSWLYVPAGQGLPLTDAHFGIRAIFYSSPDCSGQGIPSGILGWTVTDQWHFKSQTVGIAGAQSVEAQLILIKNAAGGSFTGFMDDIQIVPEPRVGALTAAALFALAAIRRLRASRRG